jgi:hypothetical protein
LWDLPAAEGEGSARRWGRGEGSAEIFMPGSPVSQAEQ